jgi:hypothetical protein
MRRQMNPCGASARGALISDSEMIMEIAGLGLMVAATLGGRVCNSPAA